MGRQRNRRAGRSAALVAAATSLALMPCVGSRDAIDVVSSSTAVATTGSIPRAAAEHRYRIGAKLRFGLFSAGRDNIGSAVMTSRSSGDATAFALLAGSDPNRVPGKLNRWAYVREEVRGESADVFTLRSDDSAPDESRDGSDDRPFNAACTTFTPQDVHTSVTTIAAPGATYRTFERLLEQLELTPGNWSGRRIARPPDSEPGFLTALHRLLATAPIQGGRGVTYVFNNKLYDLSARRVKALGPTTVGSRRFEQLTRVDLTIRNRASGENTRFALTTAHDETGVTFPVQIFFQPSFWIVVELRLDDQADVPHDPADDGSLLTRMRDICASVAR